MTDIDSAVTGIVYGLAFRATIENERLYEGDVVEALSNAGFLAPLNPETIEELIVRVWIGGRAFEREYRGGEYRWRRQRIERWRRDNPTPYDPTARFGPIDPRPGNYYVSALHDGKTLLVRGPYASHRAAMLAVHETERTCNDPRACWYAWGTARSEEIFPCPMEP